MVKKDHICVTKDELQRIARLVKVRVNPEEVSRYCTELSTVVSWFGMLDEVETSNIEPMRYGGVEHITPMREDVVSEGSIKEEILSSGCHSFGDYFFVKKVIN